jgi:hypothetical protein
MREDDWFDKLRFAHQSLEWEVPETGQRFLAALTALERVLDEGAGPRGFSAIPGLYGFYRAARLRAGDRQWAERLCARLWSTTGAGRTFAEEALLGMVGVQASPDSLPFFRAALETNRERDSFQIRRRSAAVASVAFIAQQTGDAAAYTQLEAWLAHPAVPVRTEAVALYGRIHQREDGGIEEQALAALVRVAYEDRAFAPRFLARRWLRTAGVPVRVEPPDGVYAFKASLGRVSRTVELMASQSLDDLTGSILDAFGWDHDHLYEFMLTGDGRDRRFVLPDSDMERTPLGFSPDVSGPPASPEATSPEDSGSQDLMTLPLGAFGFTKGYKFIFLYDFGDNHRFQVTVADIHEHRGPGVRYPREVARTGSAPEQYPSYE